MDNLFIKFNDSEDKEENYIPITNYFKFFRHKKGIVIQKDDEQEIMISDSGFKIYVLLESKEEEEIKKTFSILKDFSDYTLLYNETDNELWFTNNLDIWGIYYIYNPENFYVQRAYIGPRKYEEENPEWYQYSILMEEGITSDICDHLLDTVVDEDGYYMYKVVNGQVVPVDPDEKVKPEPEEEEE